MTDFDRLSQEMNSLRGHIKKLAMQFKGQYLITVRQMEEKGAIWHACHSFVESGEAEWIEENSNLAPGIRFKKGQ